MATETKYWRAERTAPGTIRIWRGVAIAGHVVRDADGWRARPGSAGRRGSRVPKATAAEAARSYFNAEAAQAVAECEGRTAQ